MPDTQTLILVPSAKVRDTLAASCARAPWAAQPAFAVIEGEVGLAVAAQRGRVGLSPLGAMLHTEGDVLIALESGADDATPLTQLDLASVAAFVARVELRARLRAESLRLQQTFAQAEKLASLGTLVAGIGHEINNPLSVILLSIDAARRYVLPLCEGAPPSPARDPAGILEDIAGAADSVASIVRDLRVFSRSEHDESIDVVSVPDVIDHALRLTGRELFQHALLERDYPRDLPPLVVPRNRVVQVLINLFINAAHAMREVPRPDHRLRVSVRADDEFVAIAISDTGPGIAPDVVGRIFDPFFTTKRQELGTGLGLAISRSIMQRLGGDLAVESVHGEGATFLCLLPRPKDQLVHAVTERRAHDIRRGPQAPLHQTGHTVLLVDDDERVLRSYVRLFNPAYRLLIAQDTRDAIEVLESGSSVDAVVLEPQLAGAEGYALVSWLAERRPELHQRTVIVTSAIAEPAYDAFLRDHRGIVLHKPVRPDELLAAVGRVLSWPGV